MKYTCVDAFTGAGGLCLGLKRAGFEILCSFDNDPRCVETHRLNSRYFTHPVYLAGIDKMLNGVLLAKTNLKKGDLFLLAGGPPCQGFSWQRIGSDEDGRNSLIFRFVELVEELMPRYFLMENVPGIEGRRGGLQLEDALTRAAKLGYWVHKERLDAQDYEVPQRRRRVFVVGEQGDAYFPRFVFPAPTTPPGRRLTVRDTIGHLPPPPEDGSEHPDMPHHRADRLIELNRKRLRALKPGQGRQDLPSDLLSDCHRISSDRIGHRYVYGRMAWDEPAPTLTARFDSFTRGRFGHPEQERTISLREGALLQTFPPDFVFAGNKVEVARQIGNAVPPALAEILGRQIIDCHNEKLRT